MCLFVYTYMYTYMDVCAHMKDIPWVPSTLFVCLFVGLFLCFEIGFLIGPELTGSARLASEPATGST